MATTVNGGFNELIDRLALTEEQRSTASTRVASIRDIFDGRFTMAERVFTIGSYARGTLVRWERDVDLLASVSAEEYWERYRYNSRDFLYWVRDTLNDYYATTDVSSRQIAVVLDFSVIRCEVVPAFNRLGGGYLIPDGSGGWQATNPPHHRTLMREADERHGGKLKPLVKLMKAWKMANELSVSSLHIELLTEQLWRNGTLGDRPSAVSSTLAQLPTWLQFSLADPWPSGSAIDTQLRQADRQASIKTAQSDAASASTSEVARTDGRTKDAFAEWNTVYRGKFPVYG